jgi:4-hydroxybenzoate polyprenyltransferase
MPEWLRNIIRIIVFGNCWVAFGATCMYWCTCFIHHLKPQNDFSIGIFGATLFIYNYHRLFRKAAIYAWQRSERHRWIVANDKLLKAFAIIGLTISIIAFLPYANVGNVLKFLPFVTLALLYVIPVWKINGKWIRLRDFPFIKIALVAVVWSFVTVFVPFAALDVNWFPDIGQWITFAQRFIFIFAITVPFDIRDLAHDAKHNVKTFAGILGPDRAKQLSNFLLVMVATISVAAYFFHFYSLGNAAGMIVSTLSTSLLVKRIHEDSDEWMYVGFLDGTMADQFFWIWLLSNWN